MLVALCRNLEKRSPDLMNCPSDGYRLWLARFVMHQRPIKGERSRIGCSGKHARDGCGRAIKGPPSRVNQRRSYSRPVFDTISSEVRARRHSDSSA